MYIAKAYVWLNDATKRKELEDKINSDRGYESKDYKILTNNKRVCVNKRAFQACDVPFPAYLGYIDCNSYTPNGTEEEAEVLFLELAQMQGDVYREWNKVTTGKNRGVIFDPKKSFISGSARVLTPLEVAEAFRDGRIEL